jgi:glucose-1-phosphate thymidylyltransferase
MAGGSGTRLRPLTQVVNKHLLPVYDRPMIFYPLATLAYAGVTEVLVITRPEDQGTFRRLLGDGYEHGLQLQYAAQESPRGIVDGLVIGAHFARGEPVMLALGDNLLFMRSPMPLGSPPQRGARIFVQAKQDASEYAVVELDAVGRPLALEEKPSRATDRLAVSGFYMLDGRAADIARTVRPSPRGELEIVDILRHYLLANELEVCVLPEDAWWTDAGTHDRLMEAALVQVSGVFRGDAFRGN